MINKRLVGFLKDSKKYIYQTVFWNWLGLIANIVIICTIVNVLNLWLQREYSQLVIIKTIVLITVMVIIRNVGQMQATKSSYRATQGVKEELRKKIYNKLLGLGKLYQTSVSTSEIIQVAVEGVEQLELYFGKYLPQLFYSRIAPLTLFLVVAFMNIKVALTLFICVPLIPIAIMAVQKIAKKLLSKYWNRYTDLGSGFLENLQGLTTLKIYQADERKMLAMDKQAESFRKATMRVLLMQLNSIGVMDIVAYGGAALGIIASLTEYQKRQMTIIEVLIVILLSAEFFIPMRLLGSLFHVSMNGNAASEKIFALLDMDAPQTGINEIKDGKGITIRKLKYAYETKNIIEGIDMDIMSKQFIAIVGPSGCGKSTLAGIINGENKGYQGSILVGNQELASISKTKLLEHIMTVNYQEYIFAGTVADNLRMGKDDIKVEELYEVLRKVELLDYINEQDGLETKISEQGSNLSGGQRQRLALARAMVRDSAIYIFDEATSNVDVESEEKIIEVIKRLRGKKTVIMISHRLEIIKEADCIYYMEEGKVIESGKHEVLISINGGYATLYNKQKELENIRRMALCEEVG